jgi:type VI secretion system protein ImpA
MNGEIKSREDVVRILDRLCDYLNRHEPSSPVPLLLKGAKRLMSKSFIEVIRDLGPEGLAQIERISGTTDEPK